MTAQEASQAILSLVEEQTGKPVLLQSDNTFPGHATMKVAGTDSPAHVLRYKPEFETELPYLVAFQCGLALRMIQCRDENRFDLVTFDSTSENMDQRT